MINLFSWRLLLLFLAFRNVEVEWDGLLIVLAWVCAWLRVGSFGLGAKHQSIGDFVIHFVAWTATEDVLNLINDLFSLPNSHTTVIQIEPIFINGSPRLGPPIYWLLIEKYILNAWLAGPILNKLRRSLLFISVPLNRCINLHYLFYVLIVNINVISIWLLLLNLEWHLFLFFLFLDMLS